MLCNNCIIILIQQVMSFDAVTEITASAWDMLYGVMVNVIKFSIMQFVSINIEKNRWENIYTTWNIVWPWMQIEFYLTVWAINTKKLFNQSLLSFYVLRMFKVELKAMQAYLIINIKLYIYFTQCMVWKLPSITPKYSIPTTMALNVNITWILEKGWRRIMCCFC